MVGRFAFAVAPLVGVLRDIQVGLGLVVLVNWTGRSGIVAVVIVLWKVLVAVILLEPILIRVESIVGRASRSRGRRCVAEEGIVIPVKRGLV
jgi:uncharacterized protein HemY